MPGFDGTGPRGQGPMTGRGMGPCNTTGFGRGAGFGRGFGRGRGFGMGFRRWNYDEPYAEPIELNKEQQRKVLEAGVVELEAELKALKEKLKEMK